MNRRDGSEFLKEYPRRDEKLAARRWEVSRQIVKTLHAAGVRILAGTDAPMPLVYPGFALHKELELLVEAGLSPADALRAATIWPAEFLGLSDAAAQSPWVNALIFCCSTTIRFPDISTRSHPRGRP